MTSSPIYVFEPIPTVFGSEKSDGRFGSGGKKKNWHLKESFKQAIKEIRDTHPDATIILLNGIKPANSPVNDRRRAALAKPINELTTADKKVLREMRTALSSIESEFRFANAFKGEDPELVNFITKDAERWIYTSNGSVFDQIAKLKSIVDPENERDVVLYYKDPLAASSQVTQHWIRAEEFVPRLETPLVQSI